MFSGCQQNSVSVGIRRGLKQLSKIRNLGYINKTISVSGLRASDVQLVPKWWKFWSSPSLPLFCMGKRALFGDGDGSFIFRITESFKLKASLIISTASSLRWKRALAPPVQKELDTARNFHGWKLLQRVEEPRDIQNFLDIHRRGSVSGTGVFQQTPEL